MESWGVQGVEFIWFKSTADGLKASEVYRRITGEEADSTQTNRTPTPAAPHFSVASGVLRDQVHFVGIQSGRIDYTIGSPDRRSGPWPWRLEEGLKVAEAGVNSIAAFTNQLGRATRIALHVNLMKNVSTLTEANSFILPKLGLAQAGDDASDLLFQLNKKMPSSVDGVTINRLIKFSTALIQLITLNVGVDTLATTSPERYLAALNMDLNTVPDPKGIEPSDVMVIFRELVREASEIARLGTLEGFVDR